MDTTSESVVSRDIRIWRNVFGTWTARVTVEHPGTGSETDAEYIARGDSPEAALAALEDEVRKGEGGWTW